MRFYSEQNGVKKNTIVWDGENDKPLCKFVNGVYDTSNEREIAILKATGYKSDNSTPVAETLLKSASSEPESVSVNMKVDELRKIAKAKGITFAFGTTKQQMVDAIKG